jgi:hypothetical protein
MAVTLALFQSLGTCPSCIVLLNMIEIGVTSDGKIALINLDANLSGPAWFTFFKYLKLIYYILFCYNYVIVHKVTVGEIRELRRRYCSEVFIKGI